MCSFQTRELSKNIPNSFNFVFSYCFVVKVSFCVFSEFNLSLLAQNHSSTSFNTRSVPDSCVREEESSAYKHAASQCMLIGKSFMYIMKSKGPKMEPYGTPLVIVFVGDISPFQYTLCSRLLR